MSPVACHKNEAICLYSEHIPTRTELYIYIYHLTIRLRIGRYRFYCCNDNFFQLKVQFTIIGMLFRTRSPYQFYFHTISK